VKGRRREIIIVQEIGVEVVEIVYMEKDMGVKRVWER